MLQRTEIIGNVGLVEDLAEVTIQNSGELKAVLNFTVACNEQYRDQEGREIKQTNWYSCSLWGKFAETMVNYLQKGRQVFISGKLEPVLYYTKEEQKPAIDLRLHIDKLQLLGNKTKGEANQEEEPF